MVEGGTAAMVALGDQVQQACIDSGEPILGFVIFTSTGQAEYRSPLSIEDFRVRLAQIAEAL
jgi:hypothetical protein